MQSKQCVLIHRAAGNVGTFAVQLAHRAGLCVIGTASKDDNEHVLNLGADQVFDYERDAFESRISVVDAVSASDTPEAAGPQPYFSYSNMAEEFRLVAKAVVLLLIGA